MPVLTPIIPLPFKSKHTQHAEKQRLNSQLNRLEATLTEKEKSRQILRRNLKRAQQQNFMHTNKEVLHIQDNYKCLICWNIYYRPVKLNCNHMLCELCLHTN